MSQNDMQQMFAAFQQFMAQQNQKAPSKKTKPAAVGFTNTVTTPVKQSKKTKSSKKVSPAEPLPPGDQKVRPSWSTAFPLIQEAITKSGAKLSDWRFCGKPGEAIGDKPWLYVQFEDKAEAAKVKDDLKASFGAQFSTKYSGSNGKLSTWIMTGRVSSDFLDE